MSSRVPREPSSSAARRRRLYRGIAVVLAPAATVGGCEAILAAADLPRTAELTPEQLTDAQAVVDPRAYDTDPALLWRIHRSASLDVRDLGFVRVRTDARGLRGPDRDDELRASRLRVICFGDSVTFGVGLADEETFPSRLESALRARFPPERAPVVINAGVPGFSSVQGMRLLDELAPLAPDVVVWWFGMNDGKPALGRPDAALRMSDARGGVMPFLRGLRSIRFAESIAARIRGEATRVSTDEVRAEVAALAARAASGGPATLFVRCPSRLDEKLAQLGTIASAVRAAGADRVDGAADALSEIAVGPAGCAQIARVEAAAAGRVAVLGPGVARRDELPLDEVVRRRDFVAKWKRAVDAYVAQMPADALGYKELFGTARPSDVFADNCHLTAASARWAAESVATRIAVTVARLPPPDRR